MAEQNKAGRAVRPGQAGGQSRNCPLRLQQTILPSTGCQPPLSAPASRQHNDGRNTRWMQGGGRLVACCSPTRIKTRKELFLKILQNKPENNLRGFSVVEASPRRPVMLVSVLYAGRVCAQISAPGTGSADLCCAAAGKVICFLLIRVTVAVWPLRQPSAARIRIANTTSVSVSQYPVVLHTEQVYLSDAEIQQNIEKFADFIFNLCSPTVRCEEFKCDRLEEFSGARWSKNRDISSAADREKHCFQSDRECETEGRKMVSEWDQC